MCTDELWLCLVQNKYAKVRCFHRSLLLTPIRRLEGVTYWVIEDPEGIHDYINTEIRKEWEEDVRREHRDLMGHG